jgi:hypothetical protein
MKEVMSAMQALEGYFQTSTINEENKYIESKKQIQEAHRAHNELQSKREKYHLSG